MTLAFLVVIVLSALATAASAILVLSKIGSMEKIVKYDIVIDVGLTLAFVWMFAGSFAGMLVGILSGLFVTLYLKNKKKQLGIPNLFERRNPKCS